MAATSTTSGERWKPVPGYEGLYQVSNKGRLRGPSGRLKKGTKNYQGYLRVNLYKDGREKQVCLHRLVAETFIPNPEKKPEVNHKNGKRDDCRAVNLEWCNHSENQLHRRRVLGSGGPTKKRPVVCLTTGEAFESMTEAADKTGCRVGGVRACCIGDQTHTNGLQFTFKE